MQCVYLTCLCICIFLGSFAESWFFSLSWHNPRKNDIIWSLVDRCGGIAEFQHGIVIIDGQEDTQNGKRFRINIDRKSCSYRYRRFCCFVLFLLTSVVLNRFCCDFECFRVVILLLLEFWGFGKSAMCVFDLCLSVYFLGKLR